MIFLNKHSSHEKHLRRLEREAERLRQASARAPIVPLERPYQKGWVKKYVLDPRVLRRPDAQIFRRMLEAVNQCVHSCARSFVNRAGQPIVLRPRIIHVREWQNLAWPASHQRFFGFGRWRVEDRSFWLPPHRAWTTGYKLVYDEWLREDVQPRLITHQRVALPEVDSRLAEIRAYMDRMQGRDRLDRLHGRSHTWYRRVTTRAGERADAAHAEQMQQITPD